jgi:hypothetical protein
LLRPCDRRVVAAAAGHGALVVLLLAGTPHGGALARVVAVAALGVAMCWGCNTVSHVHLHTPLFARPAANRAFGLYLTLLLGVPQQLWRERHLRHHAPPAPGGPDDGGPRGGRALGELAALGALLAALALAAPGVLLTLWLPGLALGLVLCALQGRGEHLQAAGVDQRGRLYNLLCFNDGYHAAHHRRPALHWSLLPGEAADADARSALPPVLRALAPWPGRLAPGPALLDALERLALRLAPLRRLLLATHRPALAALLARLDPDRFAHVVVVGGGLYPRSVLLLAALLPRARFTVLDCSAASLARARACLPPPLRRRVALVQGRFDPARPVACDLLVVPLAFRGDRGRLYRQPPAPAVLVHDWLWRRRGHASARVSWLLAKRINLVRGPSPSIVNAGNLPADPDPCCRPTSSRAFARATMAPS